MSRVPARPPSAPGEWVFEEVSGSAAELHDGSADLLDPPGGVVCRRVRVLHAVRPAVVLGSGQPDEVVDGARAARAGLDVARRRSGGGAVLVGPGESVWVDLVVPRGDPLWSEDVRTSMAWVGEVWSAALSGLVPSALSVWRGAMLRTRWSELVCFAGVGPGEVIVAPAHGPGGPAHGPGGPAHRSVTKLVGVSQRRSRRGALLQSAALLRWRPSDLLDVLALDPAVRRQAALEVGSAALGIGPLHPETVLAAFVEALAGAAAR